ncbi:hypothetical protein GJ697_26985 [Pseudoduganella sp. FT25W]|uniref:Uncharacterized protein n=1 Tax=Duganella alba TaxID=2666081 RepID=A0A6L5QP92_9BURK|nr:hypothetical protein [Duganella alba]MRX11475.1 hypothetical protein [Duganella alba]MRX19638.1 hypothetical protein [Duganella alba]
MRQLVVEVPAGELANLEKITLIEVRSAPVTKEKKRRMKISLVATAFEAKTKLVPQEQRKQALGKAFGILQGRSDSPQDGLVFQIEQRAE